MTRFNQSRLAAMATVCAAMALAASVSSSHDGADHAGANAGGGKIAKVFDQLLPPGDYKKVSVITVAYGPGGTTPKHRHDVAVIAYVVEGEIESQLNDQELKTYRAGDMWYEPPGTIHTISRNASATKPAKILVFFVQEEGKAATTFVK